MLALAFWGCNHAIHHGAQRYASPWIPHLASAVTQVNNSALPMERLGAGGGRKEEGEDILMLGRAGVEAVPEGR